MDIGDDGNDHLTPQNVEQYFRSGVPAVVSLSRALGARLEIEPRQERIRLICPAQPAEPDLARFERLSFERVEVIGEEGEWFELTVNATSMHYESYVLLESIVDQMRGGMSFRQAVTEGIEGFRELLTGRDRMTDEKVAGLIGELLVLEHVIEEYGEQTAVTSWLGPLSEEHDFGFPDFDAEVKTTLGESRSHLIGNEGQLEPVPGRDLLLVSVQITRAGRSAASFTLPGLIGRVRASLTTSRRTVDDALARLGWRDVDADLYPTRFARRSTPRAYVVDDTFPAITGRRLEDVVPQRTLVSAVSYRVDVSHLEHMTAPAPLDAFCESGGVR